MKCFGFMTLVGDTRCEGNGPTSGASYRSGYNDGHTEGIEKGRIEGFTQGVLYHAAYDTAIVTLRNLDLSLDSNSPSIDFSVAMSFFSSVDMMIELMREKTGKTDYYVQQVRQVETERDRIRERFKGLGKVVTSGNGGET
jgi:hypothetical protein